MLTLGGGNLVMSFSIWGPSSGRNFDVSTGSSTCEAYSATWNLGTNLPFVPEPRKIAKNLDRVGRSQDLSDASRPEFRENYILY
jgi:hypothetical protein